MKPIYHLLRFLFWLMCRIALGVLGFIAGAILFIPALFLVSVLDALSDAWTEYNRKKP